MALRPALILASTSAYRRALLERLRMPFEVVTREVDESPLPGETPLQTCVRLACAKATAVANMHQAAVVIGSDQVASVNGRAISKPGTHENAKAQLQAMSGRSIQFLTAVHVMRQDRGFAASETVTVTATFRTLSDDRIERYLALERPYDCAGSAKSESLGIALLESVVSDDPTALIGLPLIATCRLLRGAGLDPLDA